MKLKPKELSINLPFSIGGVSFIANEAEQRAAWALYFEFSTRVSQRNFDRENSRLRSALSSLHALIHITREVLREAGPEVAHGEESLGPLAIQILNVGLAPFLSKWHYKLEAHEEMKPEGVSCFEYERYWPDFDQAVDELEQLQSELVEYILALGEISGAVSKND